jgi:hypothetical protein
MLESAVSTLVGAADEWNVSEVEVMSDPKAPR